MSIKKQSSPKDNNNSTQDLVKKTRLDNFFCNGNFIHHAFVVEGRIVPQELRQQIEDTLHAPKLLTPLILASDVFTIDMARELIRTASKSYSHKGHLLLCTHALTYTRDAQNALLKILEEPRPSTTIILMVRDSKMLLDTILSRCVLVKSSEDADDPDNVSIDSQKAKEMMDASPSQRITLCENLIKKYENETISRNEIAGIIIQIEFLLHKKLMTEKNSQENREYHNSSRFFMEISKLRNALILPTASIKQILEGVIVVMNLFEENSTSTRKE